MMVYQYFFFAFNTGILRVIIMVEFGRFGTIGYFNVIYNDKKRYDYLLSIFVPRNLG